MKKEVEENHKQFLERLAFFKKFGMDHIAEKDLIIDALSPIKGKILEIGTGKGHFALALTKHGYELTSIDTDKESQHIAWLNLEYYNLLNRAHFRTEDAKKLSFMDSSFDIIFCINVYHHLEEPLLVFKEMIRVLSSKGKIILSDFNKNGVDIINKCHESEGKKGEHFCSDMLFAKEFFGDNGFNIKQLSSATQETLIFTRGQNL